SLGHAVSEPCRSQEGRRRDDQLRRVLQQRSRLRNRSLRALPADPSDQPAAGARTADRGGTDPERVPVLSLDDPGQSDALPALHVTVLWVRERFGFGFRAWL